MHPGSRSKWAVLAACASLLPGCAGSQLIDAPPIQRLELHGARSIPAGRVKAKLQSAPPPWWTFAAPPRFHAGRWRADLQRVLAYYRSQGYLDASILGSEVRSLPSGGVELVAEVSEGLPTTIRSVEVLGLETLPREEQEKVLADLPVASGDRLVAGRWRDGCRELQRRLRELGYASSQVLARVKLQRHSHSAEVRCLARAGQRYRFGAIDVRCSPTVMLDPERVRQIVRLAIAPGDDFSEHAFEEARSWATGTDGIADLVLTAGPPDPGTSTVPVQAEVEAIPTPVTAADGRAFVDQGRNQIGFVARYSEINLLGTGRRLFLRLDLDWVFIPTLVSVLDPDDDRAARQGPAFALSSLYEEPYLFDRPSLLGRGGLAGERRFEQAFDTWGARTFLGPVWRPLPRLLVYPTYHGEYQNVDAADVISDTAAPFVFGCDTVPCSVLLSYLEQIVTWDVRDSQVDPRQGFLLGLGVQQAGGVLQGDFAYVRILPEIRYFYTPRRLLPRLTFAWRFSAGALQPFSGNPSSSPIFTRFFGGGGASMRGFASRRLSPLLVVPVEPGATERTTIPIGGNGLLEASAELRYHLFGDKLVLVVFADAGRVTRGSWSQFELDKLLYAVGAGVRWLGPLGPFRLEFARRLEAGQPPVALLPDGSTFPYAVNESCFGGGEGRVVPDSLCVFHLAFGAAF